MNSKKKTTEEIFNHHLEAFEKKDLSEIAANFTEHSIFINSLGVIALGVDKIIEIYKQYFESQEQGATSSIKTLIIEGDIVFLEWAGESPSYISEGVDTFVIREGYIYAQTAKFTVTPKSE